MHQMRYARGGQSDIILSSAFNSRELQQLTGQIPHWPIRHDYLDRPYEAKDVLAAGRQLSPIDQPRRPVARRAKGHQGPPAGRRPAPDRPSGEQGDPGALRWCPRRARVGYCSARPDHPCRSGHRTDRGAGARRAVVALAFARPSAGSERGVDTKADTAQPPAGAVWRPRTCPC